MLRRALFAVLALLLLPAAACAQEPPDAIDAALDDLSARLGTTVTLATLTAWSWGQQFYPDAGLGCPAPGQSYPQERTAAYRFLFTARNGVTYDYRVSTDGNVVILCVDGAPAGAPPGAAATPTATSAPATATLSPTQTPAAVACDPDAAPGYLPARLAVGAVGRSVDDGIPKNVRSEPTMSAENVVVQIPSGERFTVLEGPVCGEGLVWWRVQYGEYSGWVAEGRDDIYWLEPLPSGPEPVTAANVGEMAQLRVLMHAGPVSSNVAFSPDGSLLAAGTGRGEVSLWDIGTGLQKFALSGHTGAVTALAFDAEGVLLASGGADGTARLWNPALGLEQFTLAGHEAPLSALAFSHDGSLLATGSTDGAVRLWDVASGRTLSIITAHTGAVVSLVFSADGATLASASADGSVRLWGLPQ